MPSMPMVWMRVDPEFRTRFHRHRTCRQLRKGPACGEPHELIEIDLAEVDARPCRTCYPDAPRINVRKIYCTICDSRYACQHNGGLQIIDRAGRKYWVWPDTNSMPLYRKSIS